MSKLPKYIYLFYIVGEVDNKEFLTGLFHAMYDELPALKPKKKKKTIPSLENQN